MQQFVGDAMGLGRGHGADPRSVGVQGIRRQAVHVEAHQTAQHRRGGLQAEPELAHGVALRLGEFLVALGPVAANARQFSKEHVHCPPGFGNPGESRNREGSRPTPQAKPRPNAIGQTFLRTQLPHQTRRKTAPSQSRIEERCRHAPGVGARDSLVGNDDPGLIEIGFVHDHDPTLSGGDGGRCRSPGGRQVPGLPARPIPKPISQSRREGLWVHVPGCRDNRVVGNEKSPIQISNRRLIEPSHGLGKPRNRPPIAVIGVEDRHGFAPGEFTRVVVGGLQAGQLFFTGLLHLDEIEARRQNHIGQDAQQEIQVPGQARHLHRHGVPTRRNRQRRAQGIHSLGQGQGIAIAGSAIHHLGGQLDQTGAARIHRTRAAAHGEAKAHRRQTVVFEQHHHQAIVQPGTGEGVGGNHRALLEGRRRLFPSGFAGQPGGTTDNARENRGPE